MSSALPGARSPAPVLVLGVDTSSAAVSAALCEVGEDVRVLAQHRILDARGHAENLAPLISRCLGDRSPDELAAVVAGAGPGPYTGLRVGLVTAAVLGETLDIATYGVCSLDGIGTGHDRLLVAGDARRREVYWARYLNGVRMSGPAVAKPVAIDIGGMSAMAGAGARLYADVLGLPLLDIDHPDPAVLVGCARERIVAHAPSERLTPLYLRRPDAVVPAGPKRVST